MEENLKYKLIGNVDALKPKTSTTSCNCETMLNDLITKELESANIYKVFAGWCNQKGYRYAGELMLKYSNEEITHADRHIEYMDKRIIRARVNMIPKPEPCEFSGIREVIQAGYNHERLISEAYKGACKTALDGSEFMLFTHLQWYVTEQVEEEYKFSTLLDYCNLLNDVQDYPARVEDYIKENYL